MSSNSKTAQDQQNRGLPLFYRQPQVLATAAHGMLHLKDERDFRFAAATNAVPVMAAEFVEAQRSYPIVFVGEPVHPAVVLGLEQNNLFVAADGTWGTDRYIPAYVRRYPFVFVEVPGGTRYALGIDLAAERVVTASEGTDGLTPLFSGDQPTQLTQDALHFSSALQASQQVTRAFCDALREQDLLVEQQAHGAFPGGQPFNLRGFRIVDADRFAALPEAQVLAWHRNGWLALIQYHLASLQRWQDLLVRKDVEAPATAEPGATDKADAR